MSNYATITLNGDNYNNPYSPPVEKNTIIKWEKHKRTMFRTGEPVRVLNGFDIPMKPVYRPAPKSQLRNKTIFSKFKREIIQ